MKEEFINKLQNDEKLLFYSTATINKTSRQVKRFLLDGAVLAIFGYLIIFAIKSQRHIGIEGIVIISILIIITCCLIYGMMYNIFFKCKNKNNEYFVTNKRIARYNLQSGLRIEDISSIEHIGILREKDNYGDIMFNFHGSNLIEQIKKGIEFEGVENPRKVVEMICDLNKNIQVYDDTPTIMGKKLTR